jgi:hypothetical protein
MLDNIAIFCSQSSAQAMVISGINEFWLLMMLRAAPEKKTG